MKGRTYYFLLLVALLLSAFGLSALDKKHQIQKHSASITPTNMPQSSKKLCDSKSTYTPVRNGTSRLSYGTEAELPPVNFVQTDSESKMRLATLCGDSKDPLHIALLLPDRLLLAKQRTLLMSGKAPPQVSSALLVLLSRHEGHVYYNFLRFTESGTHASELLGGNVTKAELGPKNSSDLGSLLTRLSDFLPPHSNIPNISKSPHFIFTLPTVETLFDINNVRAICYFDAVLNQESEATATYYSPSDPATSYLRSSTDSHHRNQISFLSRTANGSVEVISSCNDPFIIKNIEIDHRHIVKGGQMVVKGAYRFLKIDDADNCVSVFAPFFMGVHEDTLLQSMKSVPQNPEFREHIFQHRRPLGDRCSNDSSNPTRVVSHIPFFVRQDKYMKPNSLVTRTINAAVEMTEWSDTVISTNVPAKVVFEILNATEGRRDHYPSALGVLIVVTFVGQVDDQPIGALSQWNVLSQKGFYDVVRYSEEDVYITRDQFAFYCATLPYLESKNMFLNFLRFEMSLDLNEYDVRRAYLPGEVYLMDYEGETFNWGWSQGAEGFLISPESAEPVPVSTCRSAPYFSNSHNDTPSSFQSTNSDDISGCYTLAKPLHTGWNLPSIYNSMYLVVDHRISHIERDRPPWRYTGGLQLENIAYFHSPVQTYERGVIVLSPHSSSSIPELYRLNRLGAINHGSNRFVKKEGKPVNPPFFRF